jgi:hypothetical protein
VKRKFSFDGVVYSDNKAEFKNLLRSHDLKWRGRMGDFIWIGENDKVVADFERDTERDVTISATLTWSGKKKTDFLKELENWAKEVGGEKKEVTGKDETAEKKIEKELEFWDELNKPDKERLMAEGRPESWIEKDIKRWRKKKRQKKKELVERYG